MAAAQRAPENAEAESAATALICRVCKEVFTAPIMLKCLHNVCAACAPKLRLDAHQSQCGECGETFPAAKEGDAVVENLLLEKMVSLVKLGAVKERKCQGCDDGIYLLSCVAFFQADLPMLSKFVFRARKR